jgi:hypothetical protein
MGHVVFISHSSKDKAAADAVCAALEADGVRCWVATSGTKPGEEVIEANPMKIHADRERDSCP